MELLSTRQIARKAEVPYLSLLRWVKEGILRPRLEMGNVKKIGVFGLDQVGEVRMFARLRSSFPYEFWPMLGDAIRLALGLEEDEVFIAQLGDGAGAARLEAVLRKDLNRLLVRDDLLMLIPIRKEAVDVEKLAT